MRSSKKSLSNYCQGCGKFYSAPYLKRKKGAFLVWKKKQQDKVFREKNLKYFKRYSKFYYLKKLLEDPEYNKKRKQREKELKQIKLNKN